MEHANVDKKRPVRSVNVISRVSAVNMHYNNCLQIGAQSHSSVGGGGRHVAAPEEEVASLCVVPVESGRAEGIRTKSVAEGGETSICCELEGVRCGCVESCEGTGLISFHIKILPA